MLQVTGYLESGCFSESSSKTGRLKDQQFSEATTSIPPDYQHKTTGVLTDFFRCLSAHQQITQTVFSCQTGGEDVMKYSSQADGDAVVIYVERDIFLSRSTIGYEHTHF